MACLCKLPPATSWLLHTTTKPDTLLRTVLVVVNVLNRACVYKRVRGFTFLSFMRMCAAICDGYDGNGSCLLYRLFTFQFLVTVKLLCCYVYSASTAAE